MMWLTTLMLACSSQSGPFEGPIGERPRDFTDPGLREVGASEVLQLWKREGSITLAEPTLPEGFTLDARVPVSMSAGRGRKVPHYQGASPFVDSVRARIGAPPGLELYAGEAALEYDASLRPRTWRMRGDRVLVAWPEAAGPLPPITMSWDRARDELFRREPMRAGLLDSTFVKHEVTVEGETRPGLLLPAPSSIAFTATLPAGARFEAWPALPRAPFRDLQSDGAYVSLTVEANGESTVVGREFVRSGVGFDRWTADLDRWSGQEVTLRLASEGHGSRDFDHVFVGAPAVWGKAPGEVRRVVVIGLDTTRPDRFGFFGYDRPTTPEIDAWLSTSTVFDHAWTPAPRTRPSFRSATTGRSPLDAVGAPNISEVFSEHGFATAGIVANVHLQPRFDFHEGFDHWWFDGSADAGTQVERALDFLARYPERDAYLFLHIMDPHLAYRPPSDARRALVREEDPELERGFSRWDVYRWQDRGQLTDLRKQYISDLYDAELRGMSEQLGHLFDQLDRMPGRTLVVLHNDHGEELFDHGGFEHNHTLYDDVTRAILAFRSAPGQAQGTRIPAPATLADIGTTLFDLAGFADAPSTDGRSLAPLLASPAEASAWSGRPIGVAHLRYGKERWGVVVGGHKYVVHTASGEEELYDLRHDPAEQKNLAGSVPVERYHAALAEVHRMAVAPGWRIEVSFATPDRRPVSIALPAPAVAHGVIDPEAELETSANQAWGEVPAKRPADVGTTSLSDDKRTLVFTPALPGKGPASGIAYVTFAEPQAIEAVAVERLGEGPELGRLGESHRWQRGTDRLEIRAGTVVVPPPSEAARMRALDGTDAGDAGDDRAELEALGYLKPEGEE